MDAQRLTVLFSNTLSIERGHGYRSIDWKEAFKLATLGGAQSKKDERVDIIINCHSSFAALNAGITPDIYTHKQNTMYMEGTPIPILRSDTQYTPHTLEDNTRSLQQKPTPTNNNTKLKQHQNESQTH